MATKEKGKSIDQLIGAEPGSGKAKEFLSMRDALHDLADERSGIHIELAKSAKPYRFGVLSCTHYGSIYEQCAVTNLLYDWFASEGVKEVMHCGDVSEGSGRRKGQEYEIHKHGVDQQCDWIVDKYPYRQGIKTRLIAGNHDMWHMQNGGADICQRIAEKREDIQYLGGTEGDIHVKRNGTERDIHIQMIHPGGGSSYALSYKPQKIIEAIDQGRKPDVLLIGHFHKAFMLPAYRGVAAVLAGCTQRQTGFMRDHHLAAHVGGYILEVQVHEGQVEVGSHWRSFCGQL